MTDDQNTATMDPQAEQTEQLNARLRELADSDLALIGRSGDEFDGNFDNSFDNSFSNIA